jgi:hypothetical protein
MQKSVAPRRPLSTRSFEHGINSSGKPAAPAQFRIVGARLNAATNNTANLQIPRRPMHLDLVPAKWNQWKPHANLTLGTKPRSSHELFDFSLQAEQAVQATCGQAAVDDEALLALVRKRSAEEK